MNGADNRLERFWASNRLSYYEFIQSFGLQAITGPTFSIHECERKTGLLLPEAERVMNLMRHHQVLQEMNDYFATPIPNLYARNEYDLARWVEWLRENSHVTQVALDLSCRSQNKLFRSDLVTLIEQIKRPLHILFTGRPELRRFFFFFEGITLKAVERL